MSEQENFHAHTRHAWILFSDANARFNILIEECAHLQDTIVSFLDRKEAIDALYRGVRIPHEDPEVRKQSRSWVSDILDAQKGIQTEYFQFTEREKSFLNLWNYVGGLGYGLEENQRTYREQFEALIRAHKKSFQTEEEKNRFREEYYWFISQRGFFLHQAFEIYTRHLLQAHTKFLQMLENNSGVLPAPLLLRRWNSGTYGELLAALSRYLSWETDAFLARVHDQKNWKKQFAEVSKQRRSVFLLHSWAHAATSTAEEHTLSGGGPDFSWVYPQEENKEGLAAAGADLLKQTDAISSVDTSSSPKVRAPDRAHNFHRSPKDRKEDIKHIRFHSIRSAYFYLEQPVLFPLLYHECAHLNYLPTSRDITNPEMDGYRQNAVVSLSENTKSVFFQDRSHNFWARLTGEIWADAIAVALGGRGYLNALVLQITGLSGIGSYTYHTETIEELISFNEFGKKDLRALEVPFPSLTLEWFWEARLRVAIQVYRRVQVQEYDDKELREWVDGLEAMLDFWGECGGTVFRAKHTSHEHAARWRHRGELNKWVARVCLENLEPMLPAMEYSKHISHSYWLKDEFARGAVVRAIKGFEEAQFGDQKDRESGWDLPAHTRLGDVAFDTRWRLSKSIVCEERLLSQECVEHWTVDYASYVRNDGGSAFRIGLEWLLGRKSLYDTVADMVEGAADRSADELQTKKRYEGKETSPDCDEDSPTTTELLTALRSDLATYLTAGPEEKTQDEVDRVIKKKRAELVYALRMRHYDNAEVGLTSALKTTSGLITSIMKDMALRLSPVLSKDKAPDDNDEAKFVSQEVRVGTLTLGVIRPSEIAEQGNYAEALTNVKGDFFRSVEKVNERAKRTRKSEKPIYEPAFLPLLGDYSFATYVHRLTPAEREPAANSGSVKRILTRPRLVLQVYGDKGLQSTNAIGKISLIHFKGGNRRWKWWDLCRRLDRELKKRDEKNRSISDASVFLSSAWEDVVLVTWHNDECGRRSEDTLWESFRKMGVDMNKDEIDSLSNIILPSLEVKSDEKVQWDRENNWSYNVRNLLPQETGKYGQLALFLEKTGRHDYTLVWVDEKTGKDLLTATHTTPLEAYSRTVRSLPPEFWAGIEAFNSAFECYLTPNSKVDTQCCSQVVAQPYETVIVSQVVLGARKTNPTVRLNTSP